MIKHSLNKRVLVGALLAGCVACQQGNSNRQQDKKLQQQQQKLQMVVQQLENEADKLVAQGERAYERAALSVQQFSIEAAQKVQEASRAADRLVDQSQQISQIPEVVKEGSNFAVAAAQTAVGYVRGEKAATPQAEVPATDPQRSQVVAPVSR